MIVCTPELLQERRADIERSPDLRALADRLAALVAPVVEHPVRLPREKAMLTRDGGVCPRDGARLVFDPWSPDRHRCPACGGAFGGERHHRAWIWHYHLWLSERAIHLGLLARLLDRPDYAARAREILEGYADLYPRVPNRDNVLGPTRLFFSTYLESLWLTQLAIAASLLHLPHGSTVRRAIEPMVRESANLVASFDEGMLNRQVWNNVAMIAAGRWLGESELVERGLRAPHGLLSQLRHGITSDGLWFEGENYHFFALRGFLLGAELLRGLEIDLYASPDVGQRLCAMYVAPLETVLPDLTLPARGDAPFGVSLRQPRFAELFEIGWRRTGDTRLAAILGELYDARLPEVEDVGARDIAEQESNVAPGGVARHRLSWKALLLMAPFRPRTKQPWHRVGIRVLRDAGIVVLRPTRERYVSVECGGAPGGHGHPDQLHLTLYHNGLLLGDLGTGSYVNPSLHWYRSTLAHNGPGVEEGGEAGSWGQLMYDRCVQVGRDAWCSAADVQGEWAWCRVHARDLFGRGTSAERVVVTCGAYTLDIVEVVVEPVTMVDLPLHPLSGLEPPVPTTAEPRVPAEAVVEEVAAIAPPMTRLRIGEAELLWTARENEAIIAAAAPGPPTLLMADGRPTRFLVRRARGAGQWVQLFAHDAGGVGQLRVVGNAVEVTRSDGSVDRIVHEPHRMTIHARNTTVTLEGIRATPPDRPIARPRRPPMQIDCVRLRKPPEPSGAWNDLPLVFLGGPQYRSAEDRYGDRGPFEAAVGVFHVGDRVGVAVRVVKPQLTFRAREARDAALDNEHPDIHSDGVQVYVGMDGWEGYLVVPQEGGGGVRVRAVSGTMGDVARVAASWTPTDDGYAVVVTMRTSRRLTRGARFPLQVVVNEMYPDRIRRAGQLVLSGGGGTVYLRGDREDPRNAAAVEVR